MGASVSPGRCEVKWETYIGNLTMMLQECVWSFACVAFEVIKSRMLYCELWWYHGAVVLRLLVWKIYQGTLLKWSFLFYPQRLIQQIRIGAQEWTFLIGTEGNSDEWDHTLQSILEAVGRSHLTLNFNILDEWVFMAHFLITVTMRI